MRASRVFKKSLIVLTSLVASIFILEFCLRQFTPVYIPFVEEAYLYDEELGFRMRPGTRLFVTTDFQHEIVVNALGTSNFQQAFDGYSKLIFALGDSFTEGVGIPADMSYPFQLDLILNLDSNGKYRKNFAVVNLGTSGFGGEESLILLRRYTNQLRAPDVILYFGSENDHEDDLVWKSGLRHAHLIEGSPHWGWATTPIRWFTYHTQIGLRAKMLYTSRKKAEISSKQTPESKTVAELQRNVFEKLHSFAGQNHALVVVSWSTPGDSYEWLQRWANKNNIAFADWYHTVSSVQSAIPQLPLENQHSAGHYRSWVNQIVARAFEQQIRKSQSTE